MHLGLIILAFSPCRLWRRTFFFLLFFPSAVRAVAARCKLSFALRPGLSHEDEVRTKEITKEKKRPNESGEQRKETRGWQKEARPTP